MPLPTGTTKPGGSGLTRSEAAILAWKKRVRKAKPGALDPKIAARVKQILAGKQKKAPKGKAAPKAAKPVLTDADKQAAKDKLKAEKDTASAAERGKNLTKVGEDTGLDDHLANMDKFRQGKGIKEKDAAELEKRGLVERASDGTPRLSSAGNAVLAAAARGDSQGAKDAASRGKDAVVKQSERETAKAEAVAKQQAKQAEKQDKLKQAAGKAKAAAKAPGKPAAAHDAAAPGKDTAKPAKADTATNRAKVAKDMADQDGPLGPSGSAALNDFADGKPLDEKMASAFADMGLTEKGSDGSHRLTSEGRAAAQAMAKGDTRGALDAISKAADKKKQGGDKTKAKADADTAKAKATADKAKAASDKTTAQASARDRLEQARIQSAQSRNRKAMSDNPSPEMVLNIFDSAIKAGARHSKKDASHLDEAARHLHSAGALCPDCAPGEDDEEAPDEEATEAIKSIMDNPAWYAQHECGDMMQACGALQTLGMLIQSELGEEDEDPADVSQLCDAADILVTFIGSELSELRGAAKEGSGTIGHQPMKGIEIERRDDGEEVATVPGYAVKAIGNEGMVGGYLVKFGGDGDLSQWRDVFTKQTNFGKHTKTDVWVHHRMLPGLGKQQLTNQAELGMDDEGVFVKHLLDLRKSYEAKLYGMAQMGKLGWSSGTAPHLVDRKSLGDGRHEITQWTLGLDASYTPTPAGGMEVTTSALKTAFLAELGFEGIDTNDPEASNPISARPDGVKVDGERARRLLLELDILALETAQ